MILPHRSHVSKHMPQLNHETSLIADIIPKKSGSDDACCNVRDFLGGFWGSFLFDRSDDAIPLTDTFTRSNHLVQQILFVFFSTRAKHTLTKKCSFKENLDNFC